MQSGDIDMVGSQVAPIVSFVPEIAIFDLPMVFATVDGDTIDQVLNGDSDTHKALNAAFENAGFHLLGFLQNATFRLTTSNSNLEKLEDFKGLQIRTMENSNHMAFWTANRRRADSSGMGGGLFCTAERYHYCRGECCRYRCRREPE